MSNRYFDVNQDFAVIKDGGFFCQACLIGKDKTAISPDPRYCQDCYDFLVDEAEILTGHSRVDWKPKIVPQKEGRSDNNEFLGRATGTERLAGKSLASQYARGVARKGGKNGNRNHGTQGSDYRC